MGGQSHFVAEIVGTAILILLGNGVVAGSLLKKSKGEGGGWIVITSGWGVGVAIAVYVTGWVSGAHINPAVTIGFMTVGSITFLDALPYIGGQMIGAFIGATLVWLAYLPHWKETEDPDMKLSCFSTMPAIRNYALNFLTEVIGTAMLLVGVLGIANKNNGLAYGFGPFAVGLLVFGIGLSLGGPTGYAINPARDLGPRIAHFLLPIAGKRDSDWSYAWVPVVAPLVGGALGAFLYECVLLPFWK
jgi:glycerol uptake facilitator protein